MAIFDAFLKIGDIKGESLDDKHKNEIDVMSFSWGMTQTGVSATGGGGGAGKVRMIDFCFVAKTSSASPLLMLNCANGTHIKEATLVCRKAGGTQLEYLKIKLTDVLVSSYKPAGSEADLFEVEDFSFDIEQTLNIGSQSSGAGAGKVTFNPFSRGDVLPVEMVTLNFAKVEFSYQPQGADGKAQGGPIIAGWDVKANQKV